MACWLDLSFRSGRVRLLFNGAFPTGGALTNTAMFDLQAAFGRLLEADHVRKNTAHMTAMATKAMPRLVARMAATDGPRSACRASVGVLTVRPPRSSIIW